MKRTNYFLLLLAIMFSLTMQARKVVVNTTATLQAAFNGAIDRDTISIKPGVYNVGTGLKIPSTGLIVLQSSVADTMAIIQMEMQVAASVLETAFPKKPSVIFNNLHIQSRYGSYESGGGYAISMSGKYFSMDTLAFRNCEISKLSRCLLRSGDGTGTGTKSGFIEWFEMTNCKVHEMNSSANIWPIIYMGHLPMYVHIKNNSFYDIPCAKSILQLNKMEVATGRNAEINFENNIVTATWARADGIITTSNYLGEEAVYNIKNNFFLLPSWSNKYNMRKDSSLYVVPPVLRCVGGIITATNNVVDSMRPWKAGQILDVDGQGGFLVIDTLNTYKMKDLNFTWDDFADAQGGNFSYLATKQPATAGVGGSPIGDLRWVKNFVTPRTLTVTSNNSTAVITPGRNYYEDGSAVTVKASVVDGYVFKGWKNTGDGTLVSMENPYTFTINADVNLTAEYQMLQERKVTITIAGSGSASFSIVPKKTIYYEDDELTITLDTHSINTFEGWADGNNDLIRKVKISGGDLSLTANFTEHPYVLAWDFHHLTANNQTFTNLAANHAIDPLNPGKMNYVMLDTIRTVSTRNNKFTGTGQVLANCVARRTILANFANPDYLFIKFSTKGLTNLKVKSDYATDNAIFKVQKMQYSLNGKDYTDFATDTVSGDFNAVWKLFEGKLPVAAENQDSVFVRWIADTNTERLFVPGVTASDYEYCYISKIIVINAAFTALNTVNESMKYRVYSQADQLIIRGENAGTAEIYSMMGQKLREVKLEEGINQYTGFRSGIYIVRIGSEVHKVLIN